MKNKNIKIVLSTFTVLACFPLNQAVGMGGGGGCVSGNISISVVSSPLNFATIEPSACAGTVTIAQNTGARSTTGCISGTSGTPSRASVRVVGGQASASDKVYIRVPASVAITSGGNSMSVTNLLLNQGAGTSTVTINGNTTVTHEIGATVNVGGNQPGGTYTGSANVTATCT